MQRFRLLRVLHSVVFRETPPTQGGRSIRAPDREGDNFSDSVTSFPNPSPPGGRKKHVSPIENPQSSCSAH